MTLGRKDVPITRTNGGANVFGLAGFFRDDDLVGHCACRKPRSGRIGGAVRQTGHATRCVRSAEPSERLAHLGPMTGAFAPYCSNERTLAGSAADAPRPARRCGPRTRGESFQSTARQTNSATASPL